MSATSTTTTTCIAKKLAAQQQLAQLGEASRTLSHEIKNPLSAIRIQTGILRKTLPEANRDDLRIIEEEVSRLNLLTDRIGDFLRDPLGQPEQINLDAFVREMILRYDRRISYTNEADPELQIRFDRQRLRSVLENLLSNALESQPGIFGTGAGGDHRVGPEGKGRDCGARPRRGDP